MAKQSPWLEWQEVARVFECSRTKAYVIIRSLNKELKEKGFLTYNGRVSRKYFNERYYGQL